MSDGKRFLDVITRLGYGQSHDLQAESFDWMFENEGVVPFLDWLCDNVGPSNVLSKGEIKQYNGIVASSEGILEGAQLDRALQSSTSQVSQEIPDEQLDEDITRLSEELQDARNYKDKLLQHRNKLSLHQASLTYRLSKMGPLESSAEKQYRHCLEQKQTDNTQMNTSLDRLSQTSSELVNLYNKSAGDVNNQQGAPFLSQQPLQEYHGVEDRFTQQLTAYTKKQFFEGIGDVAGHSDGSRYELLDISDPHTLTIKGERSQVRTDYCEELARLQAIYPASHKRRIASVTEESRIAAACRLAGDRLQVLNQQSKGASMQHLSERIHETEKHISHIQKEALILAETEVPKLIDENAELQATQVLYGDYNLKLARQDYFTSKQDELIKQLSAQKARHDFLTMAFELERRGHKDTHRLLTGTELLLEKNAKATNDRMQMMSDPSVSIPSTVRNTVDSRDLFTSRLHQIIGASSSADQQQLFLTYSNLISNAKKLAQNLESLQATLSSTTSSQDSRLASLEQNLSVCEDMVYANSATKDGQPIMSPPQLIDGLTQLDQTIKNLEQTICDIITEHNSKTKSLKSDPFLSRQRQLFVYFFLEPSRLRRAVNELTQRLEAQLVS